MNLITEQFKKITKKLNNYEIRPQQLNVANIIYNNFLNKENIIIEAPCGVGKSLAYLIPSIMLGETVIISTGTITLQEQLLTKDIPFLQKTIGKKIIPAIAKGRKNYICLNKLFNIDKTKLSKEELLIIEKLLKVRKLVNWDGDRSNIDFIVPFKLWSILCSNSDDCLKRECSYCHDCPYLLAKQKLKSANIIVTNHSMYFTDLINPNGCVPNHKYIIFDEAHHIKDSAIECLSVKIDKYTIKILMKKIKCFITDIDKELNQKIVSSEHNIFNYFLQQKKNYKNYNENYKIELDKDLKLFLTKHVENLNELKYFISKIKLNKIDLQNISENNNIKKIIIRRKLESEIGKLVESYKYFLEKTPEDEEFNRINWVSVDYENKEVIMNSTPLDVSKMLNEMIWEEKSCVLTSATLSVDKSCSYTKEQLGLDCDEHIADTVFDFDTQCLMYDAKISIDPNDSDYNDIISEKILNLTNTTEGRSLVLFTSISAMIEVYKKIKDVTIYDIKRQGELPRKKLLEWYKKTPNSILFATSTFWEGVDIPGENLSCLIIDRIPFQVPNDPVVETIINNMKEKGINWFGEYLLPNAVLKLKQGFGRLIRTKNDKGIVCILDNRIFTKYYGRIIRNSLPYLKSTTSLKKVKEFLK